MKKLVHMYKRVLYRNYVQRLKTMYIKGCTKPHVQTPPVQETCIGYLYRRPVTSSLYIYNM